MPKCPVCRKDYSITDEQCQHCGFTEIKREFINQEELQRWMEETVLPCRAVYQTMIIKLKEVSCDTQSEHDIKKKFGANDVIYEDSNIQITFLKWEMERIDSGWTVVGSFLFKNKSEREISINFKNISSGGYLNQENSKRCQLLQKTQEIKRFTLLYEDKMPAGEITNYGSVELVICYEVTGEYEGKIEESRYESGIISLQF